MELESVAAMKEGNKSAGCCQGGFGYGFATAQNPVWTLDQVLLATGGRIVSGRSQAGFRRISTDTRTLDVGDLFLALSGDKYDGETFVNEAVRKGAAGLIVTRVPDPLPPVPVVMVNDTLKALGDLAGYRRSIMRNLKVLAITGSSGKTTVKEMTAAILSSRLHILKTKGNFNNLVGMPISLLDVDASHAVAVLEMGMNRPGEIARLTEIADPDVACINNIQGAHLQGLSSIDGVARAKGELFAGMKAWGRLVVNVDDARVRKLARRCAQKQITYGLRPEAFVRATRPHSFAEEGMAFTLHIGADQKRVKVKCFGRHNVTNCLAAAALAWSVGLGIDEIAIGLESFTPFDKRLQVEKIAGGLKLINDTYNANPGSMHAALETLRDLRREHKSVVVVGDMLELGKESESAHCFVGETVARLKNEYLLCLGEYCASAVAAAKKAGMKGGRAKSYDSREEIVEALLDLYHQEKIGRGDWILVKGSRGMQMEKVIAGFTAALLKD